MVGRSTTILISRLGYFCILATLVIGVLRQTSFALFSGFAILGDAVVADVENHAPEPWRESRVARHGLG